MTFNNIRVPTKRLEEKKRLKHNMYTNYERPYV